MNILTPREVVPPATPSWLREAVRRAPGVRAIVRQVRTAWTRITDPRCPRWTAAVGLAAVLECIPVLVPGGPITIAVRIVVLIGFLDTRARPHGHEPERDPHWKQRRRRRRRHRPDESGWSWWPWKQSPAA